MRLDRLEVFVLDEPIMLDMGFIHDVRKVLAALPKHRQSLFFSATMVPEVVRLAGSILSHPVKIEAHPVASTVELVEQRVMFVDKADKLTCLAVLQGRRGRPRAMFTRTKHGADRVVRQLARGGVPAEAIHGNKSQNARTRARAFPHRRRPRAGGDRHHGARHRRRRRHARDQLRSAERARELRAPDRAARAGRSGVAILCDAEEREFLRDIEALIKARIQVVTDHPWHPGAGAPQVPPRVLRCPRPGHGRGTAPRPRASLPPAAPSPGRTVSMQVFVRDNDVDHARAS